MTAVTFFEISGPDPARLESFYGGVLGLPIEASPDPGYSMIAPGDGSIGGGVFDAGTAWGDGTPAYAIPYVEVSDVGEVVAKAEAAGATVVVAPREHGPTTSAHLLDPAGNRIGVFQMRAGQPA